MKTKRLIIFSVAVVVLSWLLIPQTIGPKEPSYQGRNLSEWRHIYFSGFSGHSLHATLEGAADAKKAIKAMGTNTIPVVIRWMSKDNPKFLGVFGSGIYMGQDAYEVLSILETNDAKLAIPALIQLTTNQDKEIRWKAVSTLYFIVHPDANVFAPALIPLTRDPDENIRYYAAQWLADYDPVAAEKAGVFISYPQFAPDVETNSVHSTNEPLAK